MAKKEVKEIKVVPAKKLPSLFKKEYAQDKFEKKILNKIYIEQDKKLVQGIFTLATNQKGQQVYKADLTGTLAAQDVNRCTQIAKQINAQKGGVKIVPLAAVVIMVVAIALVVTLFKNVIVSNVLKSSLQGVFGAKTDIQKVNVEIFKADLQINGLAQANKDSPMKNLFEVEKIKLDFNLTELLKGKFHAENLEISGVALDTDRKTSGELPVKPKKTKEQKQITENQNKLAEEAKKQLVAMFENYNPEKLLENLQNELKSPELAKQISEDVVKKVEKYKNLPGELSVSIQDFSKSVDAVLKTDWTKVNDAAKIKSAIETINKAVVESNNLKTKLENSTANLKTDGETVKKYSTDLQSAIKADTTLVDAKIKEMKQLFSVDGLKQVMNNAVESMMYSVCGKYYSYIQKGMDFAMNAKQNSDNGKTDEEKAIEKAKKQEKKEKAAAKKAKQSQSIAHAKGRTVYYQKDTVPKFLIENAVASGYEYGTDNLLFYGKATELCSDQNVRGKPAKIEVDFKILGNQNSADVTFDSRKDSTSPLILANYSGKGFAIASDAQVFSLQSNAGINAKLTATNQGGFTIGGTLDLAITDIKGMEFEPERVSSLYNKALSNVKNLTLGFTVGLDDNQNVVVSLQNPDKMVSQLVNPISQALTGELNSIANDAKANVTKVLNEKTGGALNSITSFSDIQSAVNSQNSKLTDLQKQLENKKKELSNQLTNGLKNAAADATKNAASNLFNSLKK